MHEPISLDVGCGHRDVHVRKGDVGIDVKPGLCDILASAYHLPFRDGYFAKAVFCHVLEHLESPLKALKEAKRVLQPQALIEIEVPNPHTFWIFRNIVRRRKRNPTSCVSHKHLHSFLEQELVNTVNRAGFVATLLSYGPERYFPPKRSFPKNTLYRLLYRLFPAFQPTIRLRAHTSCMCNSVSLADFNFF